MCLGNQQCVNECLSLPQHPAFLGYVSVPFYAQDSFYAHDSFYIPSSFLLKFKNDITSTHLWSGNTTSSGCPTLLEFSGPQQEKAQCRPQQDAIPRPIKVQTCSRSTLSLHTPIIKTLPTPKFKMSFSWRS